MKDFAWKTSNLGKIVQKYYLIANFLEGGEISREQV